MQKIKDNKGNTVIEMCFIMPIIVVIILMFIRLFVFQLDEARLRYEATKRVYEVALDGNTNAYNYENINDVLILSKASINNDYCNGNVNMKLQQDVRTIWKDYVVSSHIKSSIFVNETATKLRRWQLFE